MPMPRFHYRKSTPLCKAFWTIHSATRPAYGTDCHLLSPHLPIPYRLPLHAFFLVFSNLHPSPQSHTDQGTWWQPKPSGHKRLQRKQAWPSPQMAHLFCFVFFQANMPPIVEAKMIARMTQQIMIMIGMQNCTVPLEKSSDVSLKFKHISNPSFLSLNTIEIFVSDGSLLWGLPCELQNV